MSENLFYCYDVKLAKYLKYDKGISFLTKAKHLQTDKVFYLFFVDSVLQEALDEYRKK